MTFSALILAGGLGTRLRSVVADVPKALARVNDVAFVDYLLAALHRRGCQRVTLAVGYQRDLVMQHVGAAFRGMPVAYAVEETPLGTGGAIRRALQGWNEPDALVLNGDTWLDLDFAAVVSAHRAACAELTVVVREVEDVTRYGAVEVADDRLVRFAEKGRAGRGLINAGTYVMQRALLSRASLPDRFSLETDFLVPRVSQLAPLAFRTSGAFIDIGVPEDYRRAHALLEPVRRELQLASGRNGAR